MENQNISYKEKNLALLSYFMMWVILFFIYPNPSQFLKCHLKHAVILNIFIIISLFIPYINIPLVILFSLIILLGIYKAMQGKEYKVPIISELALSDNIFKKSFLKIFYIITLPFLIILNLILKNNNENIKEILDKTKQNIVFKIEKSDIEANKRFYIISYFWILAPIMYVLHRNKNKDIQFHALVGSYLFVLSLIFLNLGYIGYILNSFLFIFIIIHCYFIYQGYFITIPFLYYLSKYDYNLSNIYVYILSSINFGFHFIYRSITQKPNVNFQILHDNIKNKYFIENIEEDNKNKILAKLSLFCMSPIILLLHFKKSYVRFYARQNIVLIIITILMYFYINNILFISFLISIFTLSCITIYNCNEGLYYKIPIIYDISNIYHFLLSIPIYIKKGYIIIKDIFKIIFNKK